MTEMEFRVLHSEVIEYYQYIEMHLKGVCAALLADEERDWFARLDDYETDPLGKLLLTIKTHQVEKDLFLFSSDDFNALVRLRQSRNYWVHQCFAGDNGSTHVIFDKNNNVRYSKDAQRINADLRDAIEWDERITEIERNIISTPPAIW